MICLEFDNSTDFYAGKRLRHVRFRDRSLLPVSAACVVANGVREVLASVLGVGVDVRLFAPVIPDRNAWAAILEEAIVLRARGSLGEAAIVVRPEDARALLGAAFGEIPQGACVMSAIEREVLQRLLQRLSGTLASICGTQVETMIALPEKRDLVSAISYAAYFEVAIERPLVASLGVALVRDPSPEPHGAVAFEDLREVRLPLRVRMDAGKFPAARICELAAGDVLPLSDGMVSALLSGAREIARGQCGMNDNHYAFSIHDVAA